MENMPASTVLRKMHFKVIALEWKHFIKAFKAERKIIHKTFSYT